MNEINKEYGGGLFALAAEEHLEEELLGELRILREAVTPAYLHLLIDPNLAVSERIGLVSELLDGKAHPFVSGFVKLLTERGLASELPACIGEYERLYYETSGIVRVLAESAVALSDAQKQRLTEKLEKHTGCRVELTTAVVPALLGGMRLSYQNRQIDASAAARLKEISGRLSSAVL